MALEPAATKRGMKGHGGERRGKRADVKQSTKKVRRREGKAKSRRGMSGMAERLRDLVTGGPLGESSGDLGTGTPWSKSVKGSSVVYLAQIGKARFRIAPGSGGWRLDYLGTLGHIWEAVTPDTYKTPKDAAKAFEKLKSAGKLKRYLGKTDEDFEDDGDELEEGTLTPTKGWEQRTKASDGYEAYELVKGNVEAHVDGMGRDKYAKWDWSVGTITGKYRGKKGSAKTKAGAMRAAEQAVKSILGEDIDDDGEELTEWTWTKSDKAVVAAFLEKKSAEGKKLSTDGETLDGGWVGGNKLAFWTKGKISFGSRPHGRADQTIIRYMRRETPKSWLAEEFDDDEFDELDENYSAAWKPSKLKPVPGEQEIDENDPVFKKLRKVYQRIGIGWQPAAMFFDGKTIRDGISPRAVKSLKKWFGDTIPYKMDGRIIEFDYKKMQKAKIEDIDDDGEDLTEDLKLRPTDKKVIAAFVDQKSAESRKLTSDGEQLDGNWMGGNKISYWKGGKIYNSPVGSRSAQTVVRALRKIAPSSLVVGAYEDVADEDVLDESGPNWKGAAEKLLKKRTGKTQDDLHYRAYLKAVISGRPSEHLVKQFDGAKEARADLIDLGGSLPEDVDELDEAREPKAKFKRGDKVRWILDDGSPVAGFENESHTIWAVGDYDDYAKQRRYHIMDKTRHKTWTFEKSLRKAGKNEDMDIDADELLSELEALEAEIELFEEVTAEQRAEYAQFGRDLKRNLAKMYGLKKLSVNVGRSQRPNPWITADLWRGKEKFPEPMRREIITKILGHNLPPDHGAAYGNIGGDRISMSHEKWQQFMADKGMVSVPPKKRAATKKTQGNTTGEDLYKALKQIVTDKQAAKIDGKLVDMFSASAVVNVADQINPANRAKLLAKGPVFAAGVAMRMLNKSEDLDEERKVGAPLRKSYRVLRKLMDDSGVAMGQSFADRFESDGVQDVKGHVWQDDESPWIFRGYIEYHAGDRTFPGDGEVKSWLNSMGINVTKNGLKRKDTSRLNERIEFIVVQGLGS